MNQLKSRLLRQQELQRHPHEEILKHAPRNLSEVTTAHEVNINCPPQNIYTKPKRFQILEEQKTFHLDQKKTTFRKILDGIQQEAFQEGDTGKTLRESLNMRQSQYNPFLNAALGQSQGNNFDSSQLGGSFKVKTIKKSNINFMKSTASNNQANQAYGTNQQFSSGHGGIGMSNFNTGGSYNKRPTTESLQHRSQQPQQQINYHLEQLKSLQNMKSDPFQKQKLEFKDGESDIAKVQESSLKQLTSIIKPKMTNDEIRRIDKNLSVQKNLIERASSMPKSVAPFFPNKRQQQNRMIFNEIFVVPKQKELEVLKQKQEDHLDLLSNQKIIQKAREEKAEMERIKEMKNCDVNHGNMLNESQYELRTSTMKNYKKVRQEIRLDDGGDSILMELTLKENTVSPTKENSKFQILSTDHDEQIDIIEVIMKKFNSTQSESKSSKGVSLKQKAPSQSFFSQQIHVQCPDGYNATVAAPLAPGSGWAPSIPAGNKNLFKSSLQDMTMRARAGVQVGDVQKEAHMAYCLGVLNENQEHYDQAVNFFKRFFFCARMLDDPVGSSLALNRIAVAYYKKRKIRKSLNFHMKHCEFTDKENVFAAYYNIGICNRVLGSYIKAAEYFYKALEWALYRDDSESSCICYGQIGVINLLQKNLEEANVNFNKCLEIATEIKNQRLQLDCLLCLGYIAFDKQFWKLTKDYFDQAYFKAKQLNENNMAEQCLCNAGIASGNLMMNDQKKMMDQFYRTAGTNGFGISQSALNDSEEEEEDEEVDEFERD